MFWAELWKISDFLSEKFHFLVVKFSIYLIRRIFVMILHGALHRNSKLRTCQSYVCSKSLISYVDLTNLCLRFHKKDIGKRCGPRSDAAERGVGSRSTLFALNQEFLWNITYSRTSMARTPLGPWKFVRDSGSSSLGWLLHCVLVPEGIMDYCGIYFRCSIL